MEQRCWNSVSTLSISPVRNVTRSIRQMRVYTLHLIWGGMLKVRFYKFVMERFYKMSTEESIVQNLKDAGCNKRQIEEKR